MSTIRSNLLEIDRYSASPGREIRPSSSASNHHVTRLQDEPTNQLKAVPRIHVNHIFLRQPRTLLILAAVQICLSIQIVIFAMICKFYDGCQYSSGLLIGGLLILNGLLGVFMVNIRPKLKILKIYTGTSLASVILSLILFVIISYLLYQEEQYLKDKWDGFKMRFTAGVNPLIEEAKLATIAMQLVLICIHIICAVLSLILCIWNLNKIPHESEVQRGYYITTSPIGKQTVLVPVEVTNAKPPPEQVPLLDLDPGFGAGTSGGSLISSRRNPYFRD